MIQRNKHPLEIDRTAVFNINTLRLLFRSTNLSNEIDSNSLYAEKSRFKPTTL